MPKYLPTQRLFLLGAGFSQPAGLPLTADLIGEVRCVAEKYFRSNGYSHLENALEEYEGYASEVESERNRPFDLERFAAWLDWEHVLQLRGPDTFSEEGNEATLQLRWAIGKVLNDAMPKEIPKLYLDFASKLTTSDRILTLNYDLILEHALDAVGLPFRRSPWDSNQPDALVIHKLHGSIDWTYASDRKGGRGLESKPLVEKPQGANDDCLARIAVVSQDRLDSYYSSSLGWYTNRTLLFPPSTAKPLGGSPLIPLWRGVGLFAHQLGGFSVIGCSLPAGDPYVVQLVHHVATEYIAGRESNAAPWPQRRLKVVDLQTSQSDRESFVDRFRFCSPDHTDFILNGFSPKTLGQLFDDTV